MLCDVTVLLEIRFNLLYFCYAFVQAIECLTTVKKVNKTDAATLMNTFKVICCILLIL